MQEEEAEIEAAVTVEQTKQQEMGGGGRTKTLKAEDIKKLYTKDKRRKVEYKARDRRTIEEIQEVCQRRYAMGSACMQRLDCY